MLRGKVDVGFFVGSGGSSTVTATFDNVMLNSSPLLPYEFSWIGATQASEDKTLEPNEINALWVNTDGTCYTNGYYSEGIELNKI